MPRVHGILVGFVCPVLAKLLETARANATARHDDGILRRRLAKSALKWYNFNKYVRHLRQKPEGRFVLSVSGWSPRILIVDDEALLRRTMLAWFEERGFLVDSAADGVEAVEKCSHNQYDIVALDLEMPQMDGLEAMSRIKAMKPDLPVVIVTGFIDRFPGAVLDNAARIFLKPISMRELESELLVILGKTA